MNSHSVRLDVRRQFIGCVEKLRTAINPANDLEDRRVSYAVHLDRLKTTDLYKGDLARMLFALTLVPLVQSGHRPADHKRGARDFAQP